MRIFCKLIGAVIAALTIGALATAATASAAETLWRWLPGSVGETFSGKQTIKETRMVFVSLAGEIRCGAATVLLTSKELPGEPKSELLKEGSTEGKDATLELVILHFEKCTALGGLAANSLGDAAGIILVHAEVHNCIINKANKEFGVLILFLELHVEVPSNKLLITILEKGLFIAKIGQEVEPTDFLIAAKQASGVQGIEKCEGGEKETMIGKIDAGAHKNLAVETEILIQFDATIDKEGQVIME